MSRPQEMQLRRMCGKKETVVRAQALMHAAAARTAPGSGHELGHGAPGLPAICAFLASEQLSNDDVSEKVAQQASCLAPKIFNSTLAIVRAVLAPIPSEGTTPDTSTRPRRHRIATYPALVEVHQIKRAPTVIAWLNDAERALRASLRFRRRAVPSAVEEADTAIKCAVFFWVSQILSLTRIQATRLQQRYGVPARTFDELHALIGAAGAQLKTQIEADIAELKAKGAKVKAKAQEAKSAPEAHEVAAQPAKRKDAASRSSCAEDVDMAVDETAPETEAPAADADVDTDVASSPRKKRKLASAKVDAAAVLAASTSALTLVDASAEADAVGAGTTPRRSKRVLAVQPQVVPAPAPSPTKRTRTACVPVPAPAPEPESAGEADEASDEEEEEEEEAPRPRRYRPMFADRLQWNARDPRLAAARARAEEHVAKMRELYGDPWAALRVHAQQV